MWSEPGNPMGEGDDEVVLILFIHFREHLREVFINGWVVPELPMEYDIGTRGVSNEMIRSPCEHDPTIFIG